MELKYILGCLLVIFVSLVLFIDYNRNLIDLKETLTIIVVYFFLLMGILIVV